MLPALLYLLMWQYPPQRQTTYVCGVHDAQTSARSSAGYTAVLKMHSEDDHGMNTHLCQADYTLETINPNAVANRPFGLMSSDDAWDRPIAFRIEGFSTNGSRVFVLIAEGDFPGYLEVWEYDIKSASKLSEISLERHFTRRLSRPCNATLHVVGTSANGRLVLGTSAKNGCAREQMWELSPNRTTGPTGGRILPEYPKPLPSSAGVVPLEPSARPTD